MNLNVLIKLSNAIDFLSEDSELLSSSAESGIIPDKDTLYLIYNKVKEINKYWNEFAYFCELPDVAEVAAMKTLKATDLLSKTLSYKDEVFVPVIYKHEWDSHSNAYYAMYASRTSIGFSNRRILMAVSGTSMTNVLDKFVRFYNDCCVNKYIRGKEWFGPKPFAIDFWNDKCDVGVTSDTLM